MEELQQLIYRWKLEAERLEALSKDKKNNPKYQLKYFTTAHIQLLKCIAEAELLLKDTGASTP